MMLLSFGNGQRILLETSIKRLFRKAHEEDQREIGLLVSGKWDG